MENSENFKFSLVCKTNQETNTHLQEKSQTNQQLQHNDLSHNVRWDIRNRRGWIKPTIDEKEVAEALLILSEGRDILVSKSSQLHPDKAKIGNENKNCYTNTWLHNHMAKLGFGFDDFLSNEENNDCLVGKLDKSSIKPEDYEMYLKKVVESYVMHHEKTRMKSNEFQCVNPELCQKNCMDAMKILNQVELQKIDVSTLPENKTSMHQCYICDKIFLTGQALGGHKTQHRNSCVAVPVTKTVVLIEEKYRDEDRGKPLMFDLNEPPPPPTP